MVHSNEVNKYATMYDQLKAIYGDDLDTMIDVIYLSRNNESKDSAYIRQMDNVSIEDAREVGTLIKASGILGLLSIPGWFYIFTKSLRRLL